MKTVTVYAPATVANLVCGFDVLGLCLHEPYDVMQLTLLDDRKVRSEGVDGYLVSSEPALNWAGVPLVDMLQEVEKQG